MAGLSFSQALSLFAMNGDLSLIALFLSDSLHKPQHRSGREEQESSPWERRDTPYPTSCKGGDERGLLGVFYVAGNHKQCELLFILQGVCGAGLAFWRGKWVRLVAERGLLTPACSNAAVPRCVHCPSHGYAGHQQVSLHQPAAWFSCLRLLAGRARWH